MSSQTRRNLKEDAEVRRQYWINHKDAWEKSGLSQVEYSRRVGVKYERFKWWMSRIKKKDIFLPVRVIPEKINTGIEIRMGEFLRVVVQRDFEEEHLRRVVKSLREFHV